MELNACKNTPDDLPVKSVEKASSSCSAHRGGISLDVTACAISYRIRSRCVERALPSISRLRFSGPETACITAWEEQPQDWRTTSSEGNITCSGTFSPASRASSISAACRPCSYSGCRAVVSGGTAKPTSSISSKPTTLTSSGTRMPRSCKAAIAARAVSSLAPTTASKVILRSSSSRRIASMPMIKLKSPRATRSGLSGRP